MAKVAYQILIFSLRSDTPLIRLAKARKSNRNYLLWCSIVFFVVQILAHTLRVHRVRMCRSTSYR